MLKFGRNGQTANRHSNKTINGLYSGFLTFCFSAVLFIAGCGAENSSTGSQALPEFPVIKLEPKSVNLFTDYPATIRGKQNIEVRPRVDGFIEAIHVDEGATVSKGQLLFTISAPQYEQEVQTAQAAIKIAQADVRSAEMQVKKISPLVEKGIISRYELETAEYVLEARVAALAQAQARLENAKNNLGYTSIESPVDGVLGQIPHRTGSLVSSSMSEALTTVSDIQEVFAYFSINESQFLAFRRNRSEVGMEERIKSIPQVILVLADGSQLPQPGVIEPGSGIIETSTGSMSIRARFSNKSYLVRSGSTGNVRFPEVRESALLVPQRATYELQGKRFVYLLSDTNTVVSQSIEIALNAYGEFFIVEEGLSAGDIIVAEGIASLRDGIEIVPIESQGVNEQL